ncbi:ATP-binding protein [bacterium]|nr:ATP-binding protein [candidate division CSSED10-310 bacterium]
MTRTANLKNKVGPFVVGDEFWDRDKEVASMLRLLGEGQNLLLVAPRRIGKTSMLREVARRLEEMKQHYTLFLDLQDCTKPEDMIVELSMGTRQYKNLWKKTKELMENFLGVVESVSVEMIELKLREAFISAWQTKGTRLLANLAAADRPVIVFLDELPVMVSRILNINHHQGDELRSRTNEVDVFLSWLRKACTEHQGRIVFVVCGSIGLEPVLHQVNLSHTIAHLRPFHLDPWDRETASGCLNALAAHDELVLTTEVTDYMLDKLGSFIPHHVQMYYAYLRDYGTSGGPTDIADVDRIYDQFMLGPRGQAELATYEERLGRVMGKERAILAMEILTEAAKGILTQAVAESMVSKSFSEDPGKTARDILAVLVHDGYLAWEQATGVYRFVSLLVRDWWRRRYC